MKEKITLTFLLLLIGIFSVITNVNASLAEAPPVDESRTEDDGWVEGDYEGSLEEQAQEDWEDAGRPGCYSMIMNRTKRNYTNALMEALYH